mmetsp:Transcript_45164/g.101981  ORF Transcript_45164/g.101981 Transcript_45164/m.101981 type:complete len:100 (-) Transcript_45164:176-475(-)|eukprot:CAMPEP_0172627872 /NCGR_PEP_ID=MMETSP1068-20121228/158572_1 /TAXON_ID=35684 /ORGANISM="Pseudopedinella elastica, Strain CCMP716" /LENGTH=99 /DNA_ID=CAMNT_0013437881 /DNA_START=122 /DNA_END=421 /DNA_ORIENTATION=-
MPREYFPNMFMTLLSVRYAKSTVRPAQAVFKIQPRMTKHEVKEYLTKIYDLPVKRVMTANFDIKWKRHYGMSKVVPYKNKSRFKKAFVTLDTLSAATKA